MINKTLIFIILIASNSIAQQFVEIEYEQIKDWGNAGKFTGKTMLTHNGTRSVYVEIFNEETEKHETDDGNLNISVGSGRSIFFKDYNKNNLLYENMLQFKHFPTQENIDLMKWEIEPRKTEEILGYTCQAAVSNFRGRTYVAYFTDKLGFYGGPWKFDGLPGMILKISSTDGFLSIKAKSIEVKNQNLTIENSYSEIKEFISYEEFASLYAKKYKEVNRTEISEEGGTITMAMPACQVECYIIE